LADHATPGATGRHDQRRRRLGCHRFEQEPQPLISIIIVASLGPVPTTSQEGS